MTKQYLGDGVYIDKEGYSIVLTTEDGRNITNKIIIEPSVLSSMNDYILRNA